MFWDAWIKFWASAYLFKFIDQLATKNMTQALDFLFGGCQKIFLGGSLDIIVKLIVINLTMIMVMTMSNHTKMSKCLL